MDQTKQNPQKIRNIAIIAHVDHGKTTLVDGLLKQSQTFRENQTEMSQELIMDSGDQERERGITITAKITAVKYHDYRINIIDTPGHADFSGEVERILNMADGCILVVDAQEGPMPQTKFVLSLALANNLKPIVIINKIDKPAQRIQEVENELSDLFLELATHEDQLHFPIYYAVSKAGKAWDKIPENVEVEGDLSTVFGAIIEHIPAPKLDVNEPFQMMVTALAYDSYKGKYSIGRIVAGSIKPSETVTIFKKDGTWQKAKIDKIYMSQGLTRFEVTNGIAGDIVQLTGLPTAQIGETVADAQNPKALPPLEIEEPTLKIYLGPNTSPFKGQEGQFTTGRQIGDRLKKEIETNVGLRVEENGIGYFVSGRGELHLSVLIEAMRREGYEFEVGRPQVVTREENGKILEPVEELIIEIPEEHVGTVQMELGSRRAILVEQFTGPKGLTKLIYKLPTKALLGLRNVLVTRSKGTVIMNSLILGFETISPELKQLRDGVLVAFETGTTTPYALQTVENRGICFIEPGIKVYAGQIIGQNTRQEDMVINACKAKQLTNMRSSSSDGVVQLTAPKILSLEECLDFIERDELLEVTPKSLRIRKKELDHNRRKKRA